MSGFAERRRRALESLGGTAPALLVTNGPNVRYLTGFTGSNAQLLLAPDGAVFLTDGRYIEQSAEEVPDLPREIYAGGTAMPSRVAALVRDRGVSALGIESDHVSVAQRERWADVLDGIELVSATGIVERARARKDDDEIAAIRRAQRIAEDAVATVLAGRPGGSEAELALALEWAMRTAGAEAVSFEVIVATGASAALPHARPRREPADTSGVLLIDIGAKVDGYCSDMTRTYLGPRAPGALVEAHEAVVGALEAACAVVRAGAKASDVDAAARSRLAEAGLEEHFVHSTGHGVGLEIHEAPTLSMTSDDVLEAGMVVTIEPGVYLGGVGGVRVEDLLVVTEDGADTLTSLDRGPNAPA